MELFASGAAARMGLAVFALSPLLVLYSQEAREYSCWALAIFVIGASFLRATRSQSRAAWVAYAGSLAVGLYVYPACAFLALGQALYLIVLEGGRPTRLVWRAGAAMLAGIACFLPWLGDDPGP